jgi:hypothetical protein
MLWDIITSNQYILLSITGIGAIYYCCKKCFFCHSITEVTYDQESYESDILYKHRKINN